LAEFGRHGAEDFGLDELELLKGIEHGNGFFREVREWKMVDAG
jgi:hypothetical protein